MSPSSNKGNSNNLRARRKTDSQNQPQERGPGGRDGRDDPLKRSSTDDGTQTPPNSSKQQPKSSSSSSSSRKRRRSVLQMAIMGAAVIGFGIYSGHVLNVALVTRQHGIFALPFVDRKWFDLRFNSTQWDEILLSPLQQHHHEDEEDANHYHGHASKIVKKKQKRRILLLMGGPHRGGTTILWECIKAHPDVSGFGSSLVTGADFSEGILMQDVYPDFGIGASTSRPGRRTTTKEMIPLGGLGRYALNPIVHLTANDARVTVENKVRLLNRFGPYWNLTKPVLVEKSPPTAVMSTFLQALYNANENGSGDNNSDATKENDLVDTRFLFITRHPIANALAHLKVDDTRRLTLPILMENYLQSHGYMLQDMPQLRNNPQLLYLEEFVNSPVDHLRRIFEWLDIDDRSDATLEAILDKVSVRHKVNDQYKELWCGSTSSSSRVGQERFGVDSFQVRQWHEAVKALPLDYDILHWCDDK